MQWVWGEGNETAMSACLISSFVSLQYKVQSCWAVSFKLNSDVFLKKHISCVLQIVSKPFWCEVQTVKDQLRRSLLPGVARHRRTHCYLLAGRHLIASFTSKFLTQNVCVYSFQGDEDDFIQLVSWQKVMSCSLGSLFSVCICFNASRWIFKRS